MSEASDRLTCPECGAEVTRDPGRLGVGQFVRQLDPEPEPWQEVATCAECGAELQRYEGKPWRIVTS